MEGEDEGLRLVGRSRRRGGRVLLLDLGDEGSKGLAERVVLEGVGGGRSTVCNPFPDGSHDLCCVRVVVVVCRGVGLVFEHADKVEEGLVEEVLHGWDGFERVSFEVHRHGD